MAHHVIQPFDVQRRPSGEANIEPRPPAPYYNHKMVQHEPVRLSSVLLFGRNLLDPINLISTCAIYLLCNIILARSVSLVIFLLLFSLCCWLFHCHLESYRSFRLVKRYIKSLEANDGPALKSFLANHLRYIYPNYAFEHPTSAVVVPRSTIQSNLFRNKIKLVVVAPTAQANPIDSYRWANKMISFFWPYLSHVVHHELNEFLRNSSMLVRNAIGLKRFFFAFLRQVDANIIAVEHCELGSNAPYIKNIHVLDEDQDDETRGSLVYDLDLVYEGNMNISFICRYFGCCNSRLGLKDVFVHLSPRIIIGPIDHRVPTIKQFSLSLLTLPKFGYKGIALVELAELKLARRSINRAIKDHLLYPKTISMTLEEIVEIIRNRRRQQEQQQVHEANENRPGVLDDQSESLRLPWTTRLVARLMFCTCICSNYCLRFCQEEKLLNESSRRLRDLQASK